jgi:hypothetical protein
MGAEVVASYSRSLLSKKGTPKQRQHPAYNSRKAHLAPQARSERESPMVWAITIAVFLGIVVVALFVFFIYSQKEEIRKTLREKRAEKRIPMEVEVELSTPREPPIYEKSPTENTSRHGSRIISRTRWHAHDHAVVRLPRRDKPVKARIAYCDALPRDAFAIGLRFSSPVDWLMSESDMSNDERSQLYRK